MGTDHGQTSWAVYITETNTGPNNISRMENIRETEQGTYEEKFEPRHK